MGGSVGSWVQPLDHIELRLADEGVPIRAIARAVGQPCDHVRMTLEEAREKGKIVELPRDDWPPGVLRNDRLPKMASFTLRNRPSTQAVVMRLFTISPIQANFLLTMVLHRELRRNAIDKQNKNIDVQIWRLRKKIELFGLKIETLWSAGYRMTLDDRRTAFRLIAEAVQQAPKL